MAENYIESTIIRQDNVRLPEGSLPTFTDDQCDKEFKFRGRLILKQIVKNVQNLSHNRHDYVFEIKTINKLEEVE